MESSIITLLNDTSDAVAAAMTPSIITLLNYTSNAIGAIAFLALPFLLFNWAKYMNSLPTNGVASATRWVNYPIKSVYFFMFPILLSMALISFITSVVRLQVLSFINSLPSQYTVFINGKLIQNAEEVLATLRTVAPITAHHSHPTSRLHIEVRTTSHCLQLELGRDSGISQEYWVFNPSYDVTALNEIGRITTSVFNDY